MKLYYRIDRFDKNNSLVQKGRKRTSRSFVCQFLQALYIFSTLNGYTIKDTSGTNRTFGAPAGNLETFLFINGAGSRITNGGAFYGSGYGLETVALSEYTGIVVGTGNTAVTPTDYKLTTRVAGGITSGKLEYGGSLIYPVTVSAPNASFDVERIFRNSSGGSITLAELGIYSTFAVNSTHYNFCFVRDVLSPTVTVNNGEYLKVTYTFQITA